MKLLYFHFVYFGYFLTVLRYTDPRPRLTGSDSEEITAHQVVAESAVGVRCSCQAIVLWYLSVYLFPGCLFHDGDGARDDQS
jgi:hypothetical protein